MLSVLFIILVTASGVFFGAVVSIVYSEDVILTFPLSTEATNFNGYVPGVSGLEYPT